MSIESEDVAGPDEPQVMEPKSASDAVYAAQVRAANRKPKAPTYDVQRQRGAGEEGEGEGRLWEDIGTAVKASNPREAIRLATQDRDLDEQFGTFKVTLSGQVRELTRDKKVIPEMIADEWA